MEINHCFLNQAANVLVFPSAILSKTNQKSGKEENVLQLQFKGSGATGICCKPICQGDLISCCMKKNSVAAAPDVAIYLHMHIEHWT